MRPRRPAPCKHAGGAEAPSAAPCRSPAEHDRCSVLAETARCRSAPRLSGWQRRTAGETRRRPDLCRRGILRASRCGGKGKFSSRVGAPVEHGSQTASAAAVAMAASTALPPALRMDRPASAARGCEHETIPRVASTGERRDVNRRSVDWLVYVRCCIARRTSLRSRCGARRMQNFEGSRARGCRCGWRFESQGSAPGVPGRCWYTLSHD